MVNVDVSGKNRKSMSAKEIMFEVLVNHSIKSARIWSYSGLHFLTFGLNT